MVSVITINYNNAAGLEATIKSVAMQEGRVEFIVVDGGSTDGSAELLDKYKDIISKSVSEKDAGIYAAMNKGIEMASGSYLLFINSGDELYGNNVLKAVEGFSEDLIYGDLCFADEKGKMEIRQQPRELTFFHLFYGTLYHPVTFIKKELFATCGLYNESMKITADYEFFFNAVVFKKASTRHIPVVIARHYTDGISSKPENQEMIRSERRNIHLRYLPEMLVNELYDLQEIRNSASYRITEKIRSIKSRMKGQA